MPPCQRLIVGAPSSTRAWLTPSTARDTTRHPSALSCEVLKNGLQCHKMFTKSEASLSPARSQCPLHRGYRGAPVALVLLILNWSISEVLKTQTVKSRLENLSASQRCIACLGADAEMEDLRDTQTQGASPRLEDPITTRRRTGCHGDRRRGRVGPPLSGLRLLVRSLIDRCGLAVG